VTADRHSKASSNRAWNLEGGPADAGGHGLIGGPEDVPILQRGCVHVWRVSIAADSDLGELAAVLSPEEKVRAEQFHWKRDRHSFIACRAALRRLIAFYAGHDAGSVRFCYGLQGKPSLWDSQMSKLRFNLSHSRGIALLAFALDHEVGVDVEFMDAGVDVLALAETSFSESERAALLACPPAARADLFYEYWTCKEACIKADGRGLAFPLQQFSVVRRDRKSSWREIVSVRPGGLAPSMRIRILEAGSGFAAAVAANTQAFEVLQLDLQSARRNCAFAQPMRDLGCDSSISTRQPDRGPL
jgi:4'-phosphopantetheinyl transferase